MSTVKGSITIFLALILTAMLSSVFAFLEAARVCGLQANVKLSAAQASDAVLASYDRDLWENYRLLFWEVSEGDLPGLDTLETLLQETVEGNRRDTLFSSDNYYLLQVHISEVDTTAYQLATDNGGLAFRKQAVERMKESVAEDTLATLLEWINGTESEEEDLEEEALDALDALESAASGEGDSEETKEEDSEENDSADTQTTETTQIESISIKENPLEWIKKIKQNGIYSLIMPDGELSDKEIDLSSCIGQRTLESGTLTVSSSSGDTSKLLFGLYLAKYFYDASEESEDLALDYELEYMIAGKGSDAANMKAVIRRLLVIREAANLAYLETCTEKRETVSAVAAMLCTAVLAPELTSVVEQGILAAWAYAESLSDLRILLEGGNVSMAKTEEQWHTDLTNLSGTVTATDGKTQTKGLDYSDYLQLLLWTVSEDTLAERAMDLIEKNLDVSMDQMLAAAECTYTFTASPVFWNFVSLGSFSFDGFTFLREAEISFLPDS